VLPKIAPSAVDDADSSEKSKQKKEKEKKQSRVAKKPTFLIELRDAERRGGVEGKKANADAVGGATALLTFICVLVCVGASALVTVHLRSLHSAHAKLKVRSICNSCTFFFLSVFPFVQGVMGEMLLSVTDLQRRSFAFSALCARKSYDRYAPPFFTGCDG
jgi:hypothetical protein